MKLVRFGSPGSEEPGVWLDERQAILPVRRLAFDLQDYDGRFFSGRGLDRLRGLLLEEPLPLVPAAGLRLGPPVASPGKIICVGKNYEAHAREFGSKAPSEPVFFAKAPSALAGPFDPIAVAEEGVFDAEAELALVIGRETRNVSEREALDCLAGCMALNDVTERETQRRLGQWFLSKSWDGFCPVGPFLVTTDELDPSADLRVFSRLDGEPLQEGRTADMLFSPACLVSLLSARMTLHPGDIIATGTPAGIGSLHNPPRTLRPGCTLELGVQGCGTQHCPVVAGR